MNEEEIKRLKKLSEIREIPKQIIAWAEKYDLGDEDWVEENFEFEDDGSVICNTDLDLDFITELDFPESIKYVHGDLSLNGLTSAEGLKLPREVYNLSLDGLTSAEGLELPKTIKFLFLNDLTSIEGLKLPETIEGLYLNGLTSAEGLDLTDIKIGSIVYLEKVPNNEKQELRKKYPNLWID